MRIGRTVGPLGCVLGPAVRKLTNKLFHVINYKWYDKDWIGKLIFLTSFVNLPVCFWNWLPFAVIFKWSNREFDRCCNWEENLTIYKLIWLVNVSSLVAMGLFGDRLGLSFSCFLPTNSRSCKSRSWSYPKHVHYLTICGIIQLFGLKIRSTNW